MKNQWLTKYSYAHRGLHGAQTGFAENSLSAFREALVQGHGFELDILLSRDKKAMVFHDMDLERLTGHKGQFSDYDATVLRKISLNNSKDTIPALTDVLSMTDGKAPILIEIKGDQGEYETIAQAVWQDIKDYPGPLGIMSFFPEILRWFRDHNCPVPVGLVATDIKDGDLPENYFSDEFQIGIIEEFQADFIAYDIAALPNTVTEYCQKADVPVLTWTVRTKDDRLKSAEHTDTVIFENSGP